MQKCTLTLKSFQQFYIKNSMDHILQMVNIWKIPVNKGNLIKQPTSSKKYTLLRSPHVHKKSREQYELIKKKAKLVLSFNQLLPILFFVSYLENSQFPGVEITITLNNSTNFNKI
jgi:ribosomal protein S10